MNVFALRAAELTEDRPELAGAVEPLLKAREAIERQIADLDRQGATAGGRAVLKRAKRASHIDPPASSYAIMRRASPYARRAEKPPILNRSWLE
jgi:hypothetical protein